MGQCLLRQWSAPSGELGRTVSRYISNPLPCYVPPPLTIRVQLVGTAFRRRPVHGVNPISAAFIRNGWCTRLHALLTG